MSQEVQNSNEEYKNNLDELSHINTTLNPSDNYYNTIINNTNESKDLFDNQNNELCYIFRPIEVFVINKYLPSNIKLESEDNYLKYLRRREDASNPSKIRKRRKKRKKYKFKDDSNTVSDFDDFSYIKNPSKIKNKEFIIRNSKKERFLNQLRCEKIIERIKLNALEYIFRTASSLEAYIESTKKLKMIHSSLKVNRPYKITISLRKIYKKVNDKEYHTMYELGNDLRRMWSSLFKTFATIPDLYQKIFIISNYCEEVFHEIEVLPISKLQKNIPKYLPKDNNSLSTSIQPTKYLFKTTLFEREREREKERERERERITNENQQLTVEEKSSLVKNIGNLTHDELTEIINMVNGSVPNPNINHDYFEFNIESLPPHKQRALYNFVNQCLEQRKRRYPEEIKNITQEKIDSPKMREKIRQLKVYFHLFIF